MPPPVLLYASGLGVMLYSPAATRALEEGGDYMPATQPLREPLRSLVEREQRVVLLGVGSLPDMWIAMYFARSATTVDGDGWPLLEYVVTD